MLVISFNLLDVEGRINRFSEKSRNAFPPPSPCNALLPFGERSKESAS